MDRVYLRWGWSHSCPLCSVGAVGAVLGVLTEQHGALLPHLERAEVGGAGTPGGLTPGPAQRTRATCHPWACAASGTSPGSPHPSPPTASGPALRSLVHVRVTSACSAWPTVQRAPEGPVSPHASEQRPQAHPVRLLQTSPVGRCSSPEQAAAAGRGWLLARCCLSWPSQPQSLFLHCKVCCFKKNNNKVQFVI